MRFYPVFGPFLVVALSACTTAPPPADPPSMVTACEEPRPQVCTMIYAPVCATHEDGRRETLASDCNACADSTVTGYENGACEEGAAP